MQLLSAAREIIGAALLQGTAQPFSTCSLSTMKILAGSSLLPNSCPCAISTRLSFYTGTRRGKVKGSATRIIMVSAGFTLLPTVCLPTKLVLHASCVLKQRICWIQKASSSFVVWEKVSTEQSSVKRKVAEYQEVSNSGRRETKSIQPNFSTFFREKHKYPGLPGLTCLHMKWEP